jgi:hypothetical protein
LYLRDAHLHTVVAEQLYPMLEMADLDDDKVRTSFLQRYSRIKLGGGKREVPLAGVDSDAVSSSFDGYCLARNFSGEDSKNIISARLWLAGKGG